MEAYIITEFRYKKMGHQVWYIWHGT